MDNILVIASEAGVIPFPDLKIQSKGKLGAGEILAIDRQTQQLLQTETIHRMYSSLKLAQKIGVFKKSIQIRLLA